MAAEVSVVNDDGTLKLLRLLRAYVKEGVSNAEARKGLMVVAGEHLRRLPPLGQRARELSKALATVQEPKSRPSNQFWLVATLRSSEDEKQTWLHTTQGLRAHSLHDSSSTRPSRNMRRPRGTGNPVRQILERLEMATNDSWPATSERRASTARSPTSRTVVTPRETEPRLLCLRDLVRPARLELATSWFVARRSIQLSYGRAGAAHILTISTDMSDTKQ
jgi:hypothetical protein